jgi:hypothetical protein
MRQSIVKSGGIMSVKSMPEARPNGKREAFEPTRQRMHPHV